MHSPNGNASSGLPSLLGENLTADSSFKGISKTSLLIILIPPRHTRKESITSAFTPNIMPKKIWRVQDIIFYSI
jgi:hypothetical protein